MNEHVGSKSKSLIHKAIRKYGTENFEFTILEECESSFDLEKQENFYIKKYKSYVGYDDCNGYNMTEGGKKASGYHLTTEHKEKISHALQGKIKSSKIWKIISPDNKEEIIQNLAQYCRDNKLNASHMRTVALGERIQHKGYKCFKIENGKTVERIRKYFYIVKTPTGETITVENFMEFCRENNLSGNNYYNMKNWSVKKI